MDKRVYAFFGLTFAISWGIPAVTIFLAPWIGYVGKISDYMYSSVYFVAVWGPAIAALIIVGVTEGVAGLRAFGRRIIAWRASLRWYMLALIGIPALYLLAALITWLYGEPAFGWPSGGPAWRALILSALLRAVAGPMEEIGWRGFALPLLQARLDGITAAVVLGVIWGFWHFPLFWTGLDLAGYATFMVQIIALSVILTILFNATAACLPLMILVHWLTNFPYPWEGGADLLPAQALTLGLAAVAMGLIFGKRYLGRENLVCRIS